MLYILQGSNSGSEFAICDLALVISEWSLVLFFKITNVENLIQTHSAVLAIPTSSYSATKPFSWSFLSMKVYAWRHSLHQRNVFFMTVFTINTSFLFFAKTKIFCLCGKIFSLLCWDFFVFLAYLFLFPNLNPLILSSKYSTAAMFFKSH